MKDGGGLVKPGGSGGHVVKPGGRVVKPEGRVAKPGGRVVKPGGQVVKSGKRDLRVKLDFNRKSGGDPRDRYVLSTF